MRFIMAAVAASLLTSIVALGAQRTIDICNGAPATAAASTAVTASTAGSIALARGTCVSVSCSVDVNGFFGTTGTASANSPLIKAGTTLVFHVERATNFYFYPAASGTCYVSTVSP